MTDSKASRNLSEAAQNWQAFAQDLGDVGLRVHQRGDPGRTEQQRGQANEALLHTLVSALVAVPHMDRDHPCWVPLINNAMRRYNACQDTTYSVSYIRGSGVYRLSGRRGSVLLVYIQLLDGESGFRESMELLADINLDDYEIAADGTFEIILSAQRPAGYKGNWIPLDPAREELFLLGRQVSYDWLNEVDAQISIVRLDRDIDKSHPSAAEFDRQMRRVPAYVEGALKSMMDVMDVQLGRKVPLNHVQDVSSTLPTITDQAYTHGVLELGPDEAWIAECEVPKGTPYWSVQLMDYFYTTLDVMYRQAGLNGHQARVDPDGKARIVVCQSDPGVANWLDKSDYDRVMIRFRWFGSAHPVIKTKTVPLSELRAHLPPDTAMVTPEQRQEALRNRAMGLQMRRRW